MSKYVVEHADDLSTNKITTPFSFEIQKYG